MISAIASPPPYVARSERDMPVDTTMPTITNTPALINDCRNDGTRGARVPTIRPDFRRACGRKSSTSSRKIEGSAPRYEPTFPGP